MNSILQDLRFALRQLRKSPGFALTTIFTLALGIGSAAAVFSVIDATLLRPLPYANQGRIVSPETTSRAGFHQIDPNIPFQTPETMAQVVSDSLVFERMENWLFGIFAGFALLLAVIGLYGLIQHEVELRTRDIGIRMALGSTRGRVMAQILLRVTLLMTIGIALGWSLTVALRTVLASVIEMHAAHDAALLLALTLTLGLIGVAASLLPARRAASIDPMQALRTD